MALTLEAAGFSTTGCRGVLRRKGLAAIYLATMRVWLRDDSEDMAKTMAYLDRQLARVDSLLGRLKRVRPHLQAACAAVSKSLVWLTNLPRAQACGRGSLVFLGKFYFRSEERRVGKR